MNKHNSQQNIPYSPAKLSDRNGDLSKPWLIQFYVWDTSLARLIRKQSRIPAHLATAEARLAYANARIPKINQMLDLGYHIGEKSAEAPKKLPTIRQAFEDANTLLMVRLAEQSKRSFRSLKNRFIAFLAAQHRDSLPITALAKSDIVGFLDHSQVTKSVGNRTRNSNLSYFKTFINHFIDNEWLSADPTSGIARLREAEPQISAYTTAEKLTIIQYISEHDTQLYLYIRFIYYTFRRCSETRLIQFKHINWADSSLHIPPANAKGGKSHHIFFSAKLKEEMLALGWDSLPTDWYVFGNKGRPGTQHYGINTLSGRYRKHLKDIGLYRPFVTIIYAWKHTGITDGHELAGIKPRTSQDQAGHASLDMHMRYLRRLGVDKASEINNMPDL